MVTHGDSKRTRFNRGQWIAGAQALARMKPLHKTRIPIPDPREGLAPSKRRPPKTTLPSDDPLLLQPGGSLLDQLPRPLKPPSIRPNS